jgi:hypothetical protein
MKLIQFGFEIRCLVWIEGVQPSPAHPHLHCIRLEIRREILMFNKLDDDPSTFSLEGADTAFCFSSCKFFGRFCVLLACIPMNCSALFSSITDTPCRLNGRGSKTSRESSGITEAKTAKRDRSPWQYTHVNLLRPSLPFDSTVRVLQNAMAIPRFRSDPLGRTISRLDSGRF